MSDNWVVRNLENALETWNDKLTEIWELLTATPEEFKGGKIWNVILDINGALQVIGTALLVLFFVVGVMKTCGSFAASPPQVDTTAPAVTMVWKYVGELIFNMLVLVGAVKTSDRIVREMMGL